MAVTLTLRTRDDDRITALLDGRPLADTSLASLPTLARLQADAFNLGRSLFATLGGAELLQRLDADDEHLLLLDADPRADAIPWEFAALPDHQFLAAQYGMLRLLDTPAVDPSPAKAADESLNFVALAADPLLDVNGNPREGYRLDLENELRAIRDALRQSQVALRAQCVPPTQHHLRRALRRGPAILHLTCHGDVIQTDDGPKAVLALEDENGKLDYLYGRDLVLMPPTGVLRMVLLSACRTAEGRVSHLARALVQHGVPVAIGMQGEFNDELSDDIAVALYETVLLGHSLAEGLRQLRQTLIRDSAMFGLPVGYTAREGWKPLTLIPGQPVVGGLGPPGDVRLIGQVQPPRPLLGRRGELYGLAVCRREIAERIVSRRTGSIYINKSLWRRALLP